MKILILSEVCFNDNIIPMYKAMLDKGLDVTCLINLSSLKIALFEIKERLPKQAIIHANEYPELQIYNNYVDMSRMFLVNHQVDINHPWRELTSALAIMNFIRKGKYDVIHCDFPFQRAKLLLYSFRKKIVWVQHDPFPHSGHNYPWEYRKALSLAYKFIPKFVILNHYHFDRYCKEHHLNPSQVYVNRLGPLECINLFKKSDVKQRRNNVLFFGRIVQYKGVEYLCEAMKTVHESIPDATVTIAGSGKFYFDIEPYRALPYFEIHNRFIKEEELALFLEQCSISICAYTDATQSGGILTSFAMQKPVIVSDLETLKEMVTDGYDCLLVPPKDSDALARAIIRLLNDVSLRETITNNIKKESQSGSLSWSAIVDKYLEIYNSLQ